MGKYDGNTAIEDSSPGHADYRCIEGKNAPDDNPGFDSNTVVIIREDLTKDGLVKLCHCGCETPLLKQDGNGGVFRQGHDARFKGILQRAHVHGREVAIIQGGAIISGPAMNLAAERGWQKFLEKAEVTAKRAADRATVRRSRQTIGQQQSSGPGNLELLNTMKAAAVVLKEHGFYGRAAGNRKIEITRENVESILDGTHPGLQPQNQHPDGFAAGMTVKSKYRGKVQIGVIVGIAGDRAELTFPGTEIKNRVVEISSLVAWEDGK